MNAEVLTVGHSVLDLAEFVQLVRQHGVSVIADVRSVPFSRFAPQFNRGALKEGLARGGLQYVFLGEELGARSEDPRCYVEGRVVYSRLAESEPFVAGLARLERGAKTHRIAVMCTEKDPLDCHRTLLVGRALVDRGISVSHILPTGQLETDEAAMDRLRRRLGLDQPDLLRGEHELLLEALARQEEQIAYVRGDALTVTADGTADR